VPADPHLIQERTSGSLVVGDASGERRGDAGGVEDVVAGAEEDPEVPFTRTSPSDWAVTVR
jgi:hypothetical protein